MSGSKYSKLDFMTSDHLMFHKHNLSGDGTTDCASMYYIIA